MSLPVGVAIRRAVPADAEALVELHLDCWDDAYTGLIPQQILDARRTNVPARVERWRGILAQGTTHVACRDEVLIGFVSAGPGRGEAPVELEVQALYVRGPSWGSGVGHALLETSVGDRPAYLCVLDGNDRAFAFYEREGFRRDGHTDVENEGLHVRMVRP